MSIRFQCSGCAKPYELDESLAGKKARCKTCGEEMRIPRPEPAAAAMPIRFRCDDCGKAYTTPAHLAGKSIACKRCGHRVRIPGDPVPPAAASETPKPRPTLRVEPDGPAPVDLFGLADEPVAPGKGPVGDGILADEAPRPAPAASASAAADDGPLPSRAVFEPMTAARKKAIERRVKRVEKTKTSYAGAAYGVSFGTVLAVSLFTWRIYRTVNKIGRLAGAANVPAAAAPGEMSRDLVVEMDREVARQVARKDTAEARDWLDPAKHPNHGILEMPAEKARELVAGFYERGAEGVYVLEPVTAGNAVVASTLAVKLPGDPAQRRSCLDWEVQSLNGGESTTDHGQSYLVVWTD